MMELLNKAVSHFATYITKKSIQTAKRYLMDADEINVDLLQPGDVIGVERVGYDHYGIYIGNGIVIHYTFKEIKIQTIEKFAKNGKRFFVRDFNTRVACDSIADLVKTKRGKKVLKDIKLYSSSETIMRAFSRLGQKRYNLFFNNCEHFAMWCKTGMEESSQVDEFFGRGGVKYAKHYI